MTLQEAKERIASAGIYKRWENIYNEMYGTSEYVEYLEQAAELYCLEERKRTWEEAINTSIRKFEFAKTKAKTLVELIQLDAVLAILDVTKKEFKP